MSVNKILNLVPLPILVLVDRVPGYQGTQVPGYLGPCGAWLVGCLVSFDKTPKNDNCLKKNVIMILFWFLYMAGVCDHFEIHIAKK